MGCSRGDARGGRYVVPVAASEKIVRRHFPRGGRSWKHFLRANGLDLWCETFGAGGAPVIVLIMGIGTSRIPWDDDLCRRLAEARYQVVRFDNRDTGLSSTVDYEASPYTLTDMADDVAGLLDALATRPAHIVGASLGGMIAQEFAIAYPERTLTLTAIISTPSLIDETGQFTADLPPMDEAPSPRWSTSP
jgi:pimeloyl-ACP methyl ester carboxylesterase